MAKTNTLKGREMPNHKYIKREWVNGKWNYTYAADNAKSANSLTTRDTSSSPSVAKDYINKGPNASWAESYLARKNRAKTLITPASSVSEAISSSSASTGRSVASNYLDIDTSVTRAKTSTIDPSDQAYNDNIAKLQTETNDSKTRTETYYKQKYEEEKNNYKNKLTADLARKYGNDIPVSETARLNSQVEEYGRTLWNDVYKPMSDRVTKTQQQNADRITRYLKKLYDK